jgi:alcohol dehydrogenase class IV
MKSFEFATAQRIIFGREKLAAIESCGEELGQKALIVAGAAQRFVPSLQDILHTNKVANTVFTVKEEPTIDIVTRGAHAMTQHRCSSVISIGGGSTIDAEKAIAALATNPGNPLEYLEVVGKGHPMPQQPFPFIAIPTTAGTGAEVTRNAVLATPDQRVKVSLRSPKMLPNVAIVDPALTDCLPRQETANGGLDALTQLIEPFLSSRANPMTDALCREAIPMAIGALQALAKSLDNPEAREALSYAALCSGLALANSGLGAVHGFAGPIGGMFPAPHGAICARLLPFALKANLQALNARSQDHPSLPRFQELGQMLTGQANADGMDGISLIRDLSLEFDIAPLSTYGIQLDDIPVIVEKAQKASSMKGNPIPLQRDELSKILTEAL